MPPQLPMDLSELEVSLSKTDITSEDLAYLAFSIKTILQLEGFSLPEFIKISITQFIHQHPSKESIHIPIELRKKAINVLERNGFSGDDLSKLIYIIERSESPLGEAINKDEYDEWFAEFKSLSPEQQQTVIVEAEGALRKDAALAGFTDEQIAEVVALFLSLPSGGARDIFFRLKMLIIRSLEPHA